MRGFWFGLASVYWTQGRLDEAERLFERTLAMLDEAELANENLLRRFVVNDYGDFLRERGRHEEAEVLENRPDAIENQ